ncbi:MAG: TfoX/Sxy family protein [Pararhodobacter sp.]|nr:TfoX/Sxy family protein [Pararhodobacter sp.]
MSDAISTIRNIGPATEAAFHRAGIHTAEALRDMGADAAYAALLRSGERAHFIAYYVLVMGLQGRPWNDCTGDEKAALRRRFDALKAAHSGTRGLAGIEAILDEIGVVAPQAADAANAGSQG